MTAASKNIESMAAYRRRVADAPTSSLSSPSNGNGNSSSSSDWDAKSQPLSNLFQHNMILSPSHEDNDDDEAKVSPVVSGKELLDFDHQGEKQDQEEDADACSVDESVLPLDMFEGVFDANEEMPSGDGITPLDDADVVVDVTDTSSVSSSDNSSKDNSASDADTNSMSMSKRRAEEEDEEERSVKKSKTYKNNQESPIESVIVPLPKPKAKPPKTEPSPETLKLISAFRDEIVINQKFPEPQHPRRKRPNCLFVNHFGTRLNGKGDVEPVNVPSKNFAKVSSEESVSIKTKVTASTASSRSHDTKATPCNGIQADTTPSSSSGTPCSVPLVVRIVTPNANKPVRSSRLEDIKMEEDDLEPIHHVADDEDIMVLDSKHLPYITSLKDNNNTSSSPPTTVPGTPNGSNGAPGVASPQMMPTSMMSLGSGGMSMNFNRPFPMLNRRMSYMPGGCHPMHPHPAAFAAGWHPGYGPHPGYGMPPFVPSFHQGGAPPALPNPPPSSSEGSTQSQSKN